VQDKAQVHLREETPAEPGLAAPPAPGIPAA